MIHFADQVTVKNKKREWQTAVVSGNYIEKSTAAAKNHDFQWVPTAPPFLTRGEHFSNNIKKGDFSYRFFLLLHLEKKKDVRRRDQSSPSLPGGGGKSSE